MTRKRQIPATCCVNCSMNTGLVLILVDEWVAYARQFHDQSDLPAGNFGTQFSFAQVLTESAKFAKNCLLVISLPASDTSGSPHTQADDTEVGGQRGREALDRLRNVLAVWSLRGGRRAPKKDSRSFGEDCSSRWWSGSSSLRAIPWPGRFIDLVSDAAARVSS